MDAINATAVGCWYLFSANTAPLPEVVAVGIAVGSWYLFSANTAPLPKVVAVGIAVADGTCLVPILPLSPKLLLYELLLLLVPV